MITYEHDFYAFNHTLEQLLGIERNVKRAVHNQASKIYVIEVNTKQPHLNTLKFS